MDLLGKPVVIDDSIAPAGDIVCRLPGVGTMSLYTDGFYRIQFHG